MSTAYPAVRNRRAATVTSTAPPVTVDTTPQTVNLILYVGDDLWFDLTVLNPDGSAANINYHTPSASIRPTFGSLDLLATFVCTMEADQGSNLIHLHLPHLEAAKLHGPAVWDCQTISYQGFVTTLCSGTVTPLGEATLTVGE